MLCLGRLPRVVVCSRASLVPTCSLFGLYSVGEATNCTICGMSWTISCIIPAKVCTCLARPRNASGEMTEGPVVSGGREPWIIEQTPIKIRHRSQNPPVPEDREGLIAEFERGLIRW